MVRSKSRSRLPAETKEDLTLLDTINEDNILNNIKERFSRQQCFTHCGATTVLYVNPARPIDAFSDATLQQYTDNANDTAGDKQPLPSHIFQLTASAFFHMLSEQEDQSIILSGESGSGKSEIRKNIVRSLCSLSKNSKKKSRVHSGVIKTETPLEAFGNAVTALNKNSSRFGRYAEYQFNESGKMVGSRLLDYLLETSRVTNTPAGDRNFHVFYYLLAGATHDERLNLRLTDASHYNYLEHKKFRQLGANDAIKMEELRDHLKSLGVGKRHQAQIYQLLAAILHLGNIVFMEDLNKPKESCTVKNWDVLELCAQLLGLAPQNLELALTRKTTLIKKEKAQIFLDVDGARAHRDALAQTLYSLCFGWIVEHINTRLDKLDATSFVCVLDFPGLQDAATNRFEQFLMNFASEKIQSFLTTYGVEEKLLEYSKEDLPHRSFEIESNHEIVFLFSKTGGILRTIDKESLSSSSAHKRDKRMIEKLFEEFYSSEVVIPGKKGLKFGIKHYAGTIEYDAKGFSEKNTETLSTDFISLFRGNELLDLDPSINPFYRNLFSEKVVVTETHALHHGVLIAAHQTSNPLRRPSLKRKKAKKSDTEAEAEGEKSDEDAGPTVTASLEASLSQLFDTLTETMLWSVVCIRPNDELNSDRFDTRTVKAQLQHNNIAQLTEVRREIEFTSSYEFDPFLLRYSAIFSPLQLTGRSKLKCEALVKHFQWTNKEMAVGRSKVFLSEAIWRSLEDEIRSLEKEAEAARLEQEVPSSPETRSRRPRSMHRNTNSKDTLMNNQFDDYRYSDDQSEYYDDGDNESHYESDFGYEMPPVSSYPLAVVDTKKDIETGNLTRSMSGKGASSIIDEPKKLTRARKQWICLTWLLTWWVPGFILSCCCKMKRKDVQMAWREKVALCIIIFLIGASLLFYIIGLGRIICPQQQVISTFELATKQDIKDVWVSAYGKVYQINAIVDGHLNSYQTEQWKFTEFMGGDVSDLFYKNTLLDRYCPGMKTQFDQGWDNIPKRRASNYILYPHKSRDPTTNTTKLYLEYMNQFVKYRVAYQMDYIKKIASQEKKYIVIFNNVYDVSSYFNSNAKPFGSAIEPLFSMVGQDVSDKWRKAQLGPNDPSKADILNCMNNLFYIGTVDQRNEPRCQFSNYVLLISSAILVSVIGFKFLAALQFGSSKEPEEHDKFVICQVPCYTEGPDSLSKTLESLALLRYDDKRKLIFIVCDGMIIGSGNDRPTPRIVLDILGVDPNVDPEAKDFYSLGEGDKQHNMGKVYSGLYEVQGRSVPFVVVVKVGKESERNRPGNRGKRDSQMLLMRFLSRVHFNSEMAPLELELYHHMKNIIGVNPSFYEYILMVDADTEVYPESLNRMVSAMIHDSKIMGICGETLLSNEKDSWITMIQVYEYFISHHLSKAFESLFGSVTCLPGCFCMYRIRTPTKNIPLLISPSVVADYSENVVDTLHLKNLLHLGEDRYLTTLMMKHFPQLKLTFTPDATCKTNAPDRWEVLLSQRRRWINSTVHNLLELLMLPQLCGFCCFSMRFVVFLDLFSTVVQPAGVLYIGYLIYMGITAGSEVFPLISIILIGAIYGLQIIIFILKRQWAQIGWMLVYIIATPVFSFYIPLYSFWHFDDFSWGNTRVVVGEGGKKVVYAPEVVEFDPKSIPLRKWADYEQELLERAKLTDEDSDERGAPSVFSQSIYTGAQSAYGAGSVYGVPNPPGFAGPQSVYASSVAPPPASVYGTSPSMMEMTRRLSMHVPPAYNALSSSDPNKRFSLHSLVNESNLPPSVLNRLSMASISGFGAPSDQDIEREIRKVLATADLMTITKKQVRDEMSNRFGVDLTSKKALINRIIEDVLSEQ